MKPRALDLFCKAGGATRGLMAAGFHVTGVDIEPQPRYCGDAFVQADAMTFPLKGFDFIWASPPCQGYTALRHAPGAKGTAPKLIGDIRARLSSLSIPWVIENVTEARLDMINPVALCGTMFGLGIPGYELQRHRLFESNFGWRVPMCRHSGGPRCPSAPQHESRTFPTPGESK